MLIALQARLAGDNVRAFQGTPRDKRRGPNDVVREVPWNLLAELAATPTEVEDAGTRPTEWGLDRARSPRLREVATLVNQYGGVPFPVLIMGARGTGKTEIARRLRAGFREWTAQSLSQWDFHLNCAEFRGDANMLRSALFGHVKGAHSQALKDEAGLLEKAANDCVFLDEIHWMDPQAQGLLLVALQRSGSIRRVGGDKPIPAKFRLIAATNQPRNTLRERLTPDFLDRVSDLVIEIPELRDCREDLGDIWKSVVRRACEELVQRDPARAIGSGSGSGRVDDLLAEFQPHHIKIERAISAMRLAGNFRDLEKLARRLIVGGLAKGRFLSLKGELVRSELDRLRKEERADVEQEAGPATSLIDELPTLARCEDYLREMRSAGTVLSGPAAVDEWERRLLVAAHAVGGNGAKGAELLGMNPRTFNSKMEKWDAGTASNGTSRRRTRPNLE
jgi:transcriptional regulator with AAA-type ATPase domain